MGFFLRPTTQDALLDYGDDVAVATALAGFGIIALNSPAFNLSSSAVFSLATICLGAAAIWIEMGMSRLHTRFFENPLTAKILTIAGGLLSMIAVISVIEFNKATRVASICERVENTAANELASSGRCR